MANFQPEKIIAAAEYVGFNPEETAIIREFLQLLDLPGKVKDLFFELSTLLETDPNAILKIQAMDVDRLIGADHGRALFLVLTLNQVEAAILRRTHRGISEAITKTTLSDISLWTRALQIFKDPFGIDFDILEWSQTYLKEELVRLGTFNFRLFNFSFPIRVYRNKKNGELAATYVENPNRPLEFDLAAGLPTKNPWIEPNDEWQLALKGGDSLIRVHIPVDARLDFGYLMEMVKEAFEHFSRLNPSVKPLGILGESWFFGREIVPILRNPMIIRLVSVGSFYPSTITEANTIRRLFGPHVTRADLKLMPREGMNSMLKMIVEFLDVPGNALLPRGAFLLDQELNQQPEFNPLIKKS